MSQQVKAGIISDLLHAADHALARVVINTGPIAYRRPDGIAVIPLALLSP